jgi:SAM-dependent methyltransferase
MHQESKAEMEKFIRNYLNPNKKHKILDVGSMDIGGCYKPLFNKEGWTYLGIDIAEGKNVDSVVEPYDYKMNNKFDVVVSGQCGEHVADLHKWAKAIDKTMKKDALACIIIPHTQGYHTWDRRSEHTYKDFWRVRLDGMRYLFTEVVKLKELEVYEDVRDTVGIFCKK